MHLMKVEVNCVSSAFYFCSRIQVYPEHIEVFWVYYGFYSLTRTYKIIITTTISITNNNNSIVVVIIGIVSRSWEKIGKILS